jgi:hypothetical protein
MSKSIKTKMRTHFQWPRDSTATEEDESEIQTRIHVIRLHYDDQFKMRIKQTRLGIRRLGRAHEF